MALDHLPADGGAARRPAGALLLAKGTTQCEVEAEAPPQLLISDDIKVVWK